MLSGTVTFTKIVDVGFANHKPIGGDNSAYFEQRSLQLVVLPEPGVLARAGPRLAAAAACR